MIAKTLLRLGAMNLHARLSGERMRKIQNRRLRNIVAHAYENVKFYRDLLDSHGIRPADIQSVEDLQQLPLTGKDDLIRRPLSERIARNASLKRCACHRTSGSTGTPFSVWFSGREHKIRTLADLRAMRHNGFRLTDRTLVIRDIQGNPQMRFWFQRAGILRHDYIDLRESSAVMLRRLSIGGFDVLRGTVSNLSLLSEKIIAGAIRAPKPRMIRTGAQPLDPERRAIIQRAFGVDPFDFYGSVEFGFIAWQCRERSGYHINSDLLLVELIRDGKPCRPGETGEVVVTSLFSETMPFIRYSLGDLAAFSGRACPCGCGLPLLEKIAGRLADYIVLPSGERLPPFTLTCSVGSTRGLESFQITQKNPREITVTYVAPPAQSRAIAAQIKKKLTALLGNEISIKTRRTDRIAREKGKFKVVSRLG